MAPRRKNTNVASVTEKVEEIHHDNTDNTDNNTKIISLENSVKLDDTITADTKTINIDDTTTKKKASRSTTRKKTDTAVSSVPNHVIENPIIQQTAIYHIHTNDTVVHTNINQVTNTDGTDEKKEFIDEIMESVSKDATKTRKKQVINRNKVKSGINTDCSIARSSATATETETENIIIHLPIHSDGQSLPEQTNEVGPSSSSYRYDPHISIPTGYEVTNDGYQYIRPASVLNVPNFLNSELVGTNYPPASSQCQYPFDVNNKNTAFVPDQASIEVSNKNSGRQGSIVNNITNCMEDIKADTVNQLKTSRENDIHSILRNSKTNVEKCLTQMEDCNKNNTWAKSTSVHCWWCCHPFDNPPCAIPNEYKNGIYNVYGVFCSPECAAAYNFDDMRTSTDVWERYSLLNMLYRNVYSDKHYKIKLAPPRQTLKIFGGTLTIKEFRANFQSLTHSYKIIMPPMISIIPVQELSSIDKGFTSKQDTRELTPSLDTFDDTLSTSSSSNQTNSGGLRLKRSKPFVACKNTLNKCMQITIHREEQESTSDTDNDQNDDTSIGSYEDDM
jgi:hypothetical protein